LLFARSGAAGSPPASHVHPSANARAWLTSIGVGQLRGFRLAEQTTGTETVGPESVSRSEGNPLPMSFVPSLFENGRRECTQVPVLCQPFRELRTTAAVSRGRNRRQRFPDSLADRRLLQMNPARLQQSQRSTRSY